MERMTLDLSAKPCRFPALTKQAHGTICGVSTEATSFYFSDKILMTVCQGGKLSQWIHVPTDTADPATSTEHRLLPTVGDDPGLDFEDGENSNEIDGLLPLPYLTPKTILGGSTSERSTVGRLLAAHAATMMIARDADETRLVVLGLGLEMGTPEGGIEREGFFDLLELMLRVV
ncbi:MAG: hypothetical protein M1825_004548 [Sarcosagium campestre]|nr:MAG: hypothetical protein M1825_004548 [Sarcosagium campestre]